jgi:hypothetical protein
MSASERLKALDVAIGTGTGVDRFTAKNEHDVPLTTVHILSADLTSLRLALPQIVAVTNAAEATTRVWHGPGGTGMLNTTHARQRAALAALEEVLS